MLIANFRKKVEARLYRNPTFGPLLPVASKGLALALSPPRITGADGIHPEQRTPLATYPLVMSGLVRPALCNT